jgi:hypothetical protein
VLDENGALTLLDKNAVSADETLLLLRYLKRGNDDLQAKMRQMKGEISRAARK